jgi:hypothetical protein
MSDCGIIEYNEWNMITNNIENTDEETIRAMMNDEYEYIVSEINDYLKKLECNVFHIDGVMNLWNRSVPVDKPLKIYDFKDDFISKIVDDTMYLTIKFNPKTEEIKIEKIHHDGTNYYTLSPIECWKKDEIKEYILDLFNNKREELNEFIKDYDEIPFSRRTKTELLELIEAYIEEY